MSTSSYEEHSEEEIFDLSSPVIVDKYKSAANIANSAMMLVLESVAPGVNVFDLCTVGDDLIVEETAKVYNKLKNIKKGIAFPTSISVNNCVGNYSPESESKSRILEEGDVLKIDLGVQIDGFISVCAHTTVVNAEGGQISGPVADVICAAYYAHEIAYKLIRPGKTNTDVTNAIQRTADCFDVRPVQGVLSHELLKDTIDGDRCIINRAELEHTVDEFQFEVNQVYTIDIVMSTGEGKTRELDTRATTVFRTVPDMIYSLKSKHAKTLLGESRNKFGAMPWNIKNFDITKARVGAKEMLEHGLLQPYPILYEKDGETVAQFKSTILVLPNSTQRLNEGFPLPFVSSGFSYETDEVLVEAMSLSTQRKKRRRRKK